MAWALVHKLLEGRGRHHTQAHTSGRSGRHGGGGVKGKGAGGNGVGREGARRWRPGRRVMALSAVVLLASYRRYQVKKKEKPFCGVRCAELHLGNKYLIHWLFVSREDKLFERVGGGAVVACL